MRRGWDCYESSHSRLFAACVLWLGGCVFDGSGMLPTFDTQPPAWSDDQGVGDQLSRTRAAAEASVEDSDVDARADQSHDFADPTRDSSVDQQPDATSSCDDIYGAVAGYTLCEHTRTTCRFRFKTRSEWSCQSVCGSVGRACVWAAENDSEACEEDDEVSCTAKDREAICECDR